MFALIKNRLDLPSWLLAGMILFNLIVAVVIHKDFGLTWDEPLFYQYGDSVGYAYSIQNRLSPNFDIDNAYGPSGDDHKIYGPAYLLVGQAVRKIYGWFIPESLWSGWRLANFTFFQAGLVVLYIFSRRWLNSWAALAATALMACFTCRMILPISSSNREMRISYLLLK